MLASPLSASPADHSAQMADSVNRSVLLLTNGADARLTLTINGAVASTVTPSDTADTLSPLSISVARTKQ